MEINSALFAASGLGRLRRMNLFAYGSLILPEVWESVAGRMHPSETGSIRGFVRRTVRDATYPGILETGNGGDTVSGVIYRDVDAASVEALDAFESDFYRRQALDARTRAESIVRCEAYVVPAEHAHLVSDTPWDLDTFARDHLAAFLGRNFS